MMKRLLLIFLSVSIAVLSILSCKNENDNLDVDLNQYNSDSYEANHIDEWIMSNLTNPYNLEVRWRFERNLTDVSRDISPIDQDKVIPTMELVLEGFIKVYERQVSETFIKTYAPKQWVLYGSGSYNDNGTLNLGTADGGRRVVLYEANGTVLNAAGAKRRLRTIHHEFTHILNQIVAIPPSFELISAADYLIDWTNNTLNPEHVARDLGFVSRYARHSPGEDFAEMVAHLLVEGDIWFNNYLTEAAVDGRSALLAKKAVIEEYFISYFDATLEDIQADVQSVLENNYGVVQPEDLSQTLANWLANDVVSTIRYTPGAQYLTDHGTPQVFSELMENMEAALRAQNTGWPNGTIDYLEFRFINAEDLDLRIGFKTGPTSNVFVADFYFKMDMHVPSGTIVFNKVAVRNTSGVATHYTANGQYLTQGFDTYLLPYFVNRTFIAAWLPTTIEPDSPLYRGYGGFHVQGVASNYVYGPLVLK